MRHQINGARRRFVHRGRHRRRTGRGVGQGFRPGRLPRFGRRRSATAHLSISFDDSAFRDIFFDNWPDLYFKVYCYNELLASTENSVLWNVSNPQVGVTIKAPPSQAAGVRRAAHLSEDRANRGLQPGSAAGQGRAAGAVRPRLHALPRPRERADPAGRDRCALADCGRVSRIPRLRLSDPEARQADCG